jgi:hypothetical protein
MKRAMRSPSKSESDSVIMIGESDDSFTWNNINWAIDDYVTSKKIDGLAANKEFKELFPEFRGAQDFRKGVNERGTILELKPDEGRVLVEWYELEEEQGQCWCNVEHLAKDVDGKKKMEQHEWQVGEWCVSREDALRCSLCRRSRFF